MCTGKQHDCMYDSIYDLAGGKTCRVCKIELTSQMSSSKQAEVLHIYRGAIASGNEVINNHQVRDCIAQEWSVECFEWKQVRLMDGFPCLVTRRYIPAVQIRTVIIDSSRTHAVALTTAPATKFFASIDDACFSTTRTSAASHLTWTAPRRPIFNNLATALDKRHLLAL